MAGMVQFSGGRECQNQLQGATPFEFVCAPDLV
ncbi:hypothetical protein NB311A_18026 [Nitrobacter sp. Nb-311A]|nr:hypothetical protein NB311A_18026 [Nitrobacter sp. Nb-311A]